MPSQSFLSEEGCHWFDVGVSPDVFILDVVLLGIASWRGVFCIELNIGDEYSSPVMGADV